MKNELILELADSAVKNMSGSLNIPDEFCLRFADLILFECIKIAVFKGDGTTGRAIKEHFGVE